MKEIKITSNGIKQAIDDLVDENERLQDKVYKLEDIIKEVREYVEENWISQKDADNYRFDDEELNIEISDIAVLFDVLDKEVN